MQFGIDKLVCFETINLRFEQYAYFRSGREIDRARVFELPFLRILSLQQTNHF
jgi:hypothetical protein